MSAKQGDNNPPNPIDDITARYADIIEECGNWLDGENVANEKQMKAVDALSKQMKEAKKELVAAEKSEAVPMYDAWKAKKAEFKPTLDDFALIIAGLASAQTDFKNKLAAEKEAAKRKAYEEARRKEDEAAKLAAQAAANDIEAQREVAQAQAAAMSAKQAASVANRDKVTGMRTYKTAVVVDRAAFFKYLQAHHQQDVFDWLDERATKLMNAGDTSIAGVKIETEKRGY